MMNKIKMDITNIIVVQTEIKIEDQENKEKEVNIHI